MRFDRRTFIKKKCERPNLLGHRSHVKKSAKRLLKSHKFSVVNSKID